MKEKIYLDRRRLIEERTKDLLRRMNLEEKICQMCAISGGKVLEKVKFSLKKAKKNIGKGIGEIGGILRGLGPEEGAKLANKIQKFAIENTRMGIPIIIHDECLHGCCAKKSTSFPQAIGMASTWDTELIQRIGYVVGKETRARGIHQALSPDLDVSREPRWGRTEETYGEDPYLVSRMGVNFIKGIQGENFTDKNSIIATAKHFSVHNSPEGGLNISPTVAGERTIREVFLPPFKSAVEEANAISVMPAYSEIDGIPAHANKELLTKILREEWGFNGFVVSDYGGINMLFSSHHLVSDKKEAAKQAVEAGVDMELPDIDCFPELLQAVKEGRVSEEAIDQAVRRILRAKFLLGLFENPDVNPEYAAKICDCKEHRKLALKVAHKSTVLLKNDGLLPLNKNLNSIAVIGPNANEIRLGNYSGFGMKVVTILEGIKNKISKKVKVYYTKGCEIFGNSKKGFKEAAEVAEKSDVAILVVGEVSDWGEKFPTCGEGFDVDDLNLSGVQSDLIEEIYRVQKKIVVILVNGRPLAIPGIKRNIPVILEAWYPGEEGGNAIADILFGDCTPSGKLPITFPSSVGQLPVYYNHKPSARGYYHQPGSPERPARDYVFSKPEPLFVFGYGLSYTKFEYRNLSIEPREIGPKGKVKVSVEVKNIGKFEGEEVVQLYLRDVVSSVTRPVKELKGFRRITLKLNEKKKVEFILTEKELSFLDRQMELIVEPGIFEVMVGGNSTEGIKGNFKVR